MNKKTVSILKKLEKTRKKYWNIDPNVGLFLNLLIKDRKYKRILEIGTSNGYSGIWIAEALSYTKGILYTIESHHKERFHLASKNFETTGLTRYVYQILGHAPEDIPANPRKFNMAFFDATKCEHISYWKAIAPRIKKHGIIITDNIISHKKELKAYTTAVKKNKAWKSVILEIGSGIMISQKN